MATKMTADKVINEAKKHIGYIGKPGKINMFGEYYGWNGVDWCVQFVYYCFSKSGCGKLFLNGGKTAICSGMENFYRPLGQLYERYPSGKEKQLTQATAEPGDIVIYDFDYDRENDHTGIVVENHGNYIVAIEGNTSVENQSHGNGVEKKERDYKYIKAICKPAFDVGIKSEIVPNKPKPAPTPEPTPSDEYTRKQFIRDVQEAIDVKVDGIAGRITLSHTPTISKTRNNKHKVVKYIQKRLTQLNYAELKIDGVYGDKTEAALIAYQKRNGCKPDGEITAGQKTWQNLLGLL